MWTWIFIFGGLFIAYEVAKAQKRSREKRRTESLEEINEKMEDGGQE